jgi:hypothetical protein
MPGTSLAWSAAEVFRPVGTRCGIDGPPRVPSRRCRVVRPSATGDRGGKVRFTVTVTELGCITVFADIDAAPDGH